MLFTIAIPFFKRTELIKKAIKSAINQNFDEPYEILIIDDSCDTKISDEVNSFLIELNNSKIKYIKNEKNLGMFENWNKCIKESAGQYVTLLNDDDELAQNFLQTAKNYLDGKKLIIFSFFTIGNKNKKKNFVYYLKNILFLLSLEKPKKIRLINFLFRNPSNGSLGVIFSKKSALEIGGYRPNYFPTSDYFFNLKYVINHGGIFIKRKLAYYRFQTNVSLKDHIQVRFVNNDYFLRRMIFKSYFMNEDFRYRICNIINKLQACTQFSRYIINNNIHINNLSNLDINLKRRYKLLMVKVFSRFQLLIIVMDLIIVFLWFIMIGRKDIKKIQFRSF